MLFRLKNIVLFCAFLASVSAENLPKQKTMYVKDLLTLSKAAAMTNLMNLNESPCENFYEFSCGNWRKINPAAIIAGNSRTTIFDEMKMAFERKLIKLLSAKDSDTADTTTDRKMKLYFQSCMESYTNRSQLLKQFSKYGDMPAVFGVAWNENSFDWLELMASVKRDFGLELLIGLDVAIDHNHGRTYSIYIGIANLLKFPNKSFYLGLNNRVAYRNEVAWQLKEFLNIQPDNMALQLAEEIVGFEILLANGFPSDQNNENPITESTVDDLQKKYGSTINFKRYFNTTLGEIPKGTIYVYMDKYLENLKYVLESTNQRLLANYMYFTFYKEFFLSRQSTKQSRQTLCLHKVRQYFTESLENMAFRKLNLAASEDDLKTIWITLRKVFKLQLYSKTLHWMTPTVREYAESKLNEISIKINAYESTNFTEHFAGLLIKNDNYLENMKQIFNLNIKYVFEKINKPVSAEDTFDFSSATPFTTYTENTIKIPIVLLQPYFFWAANYPSAMKFGTLGFLIARELIHSFDAKGRIYNKEGEMKNWWDEPTTTAYMVDRECFIKQYPKRFYTNIQSENIDAESENIADSGALKLAFNAFVVWKKSEMLENSDFSEKLPNMNYTNEQLFFLSFAQLWCNKDLPAENFLANRDHHIPGHFRVNGALSNAEEFSNAFHCNTESAMSPEVYCELF